MNLTRASIVPQGFAGRQRKKTTMEEINLSTKNKDSDQHQVASLG
jgi:hypothetical protein